MRLFSRMAYLGLCMLAMGAALPARAAQHASSEPPAIENSVVKIFATMRYPDPFKPWTKQGPTDVSGSGVVIDGKRYNSAWGPNKKMAEQKAALLALEELGVLDAKEVDKAIEEIVDTSSSD